MDDNMCPKIAIIGGSGFYDFPEMVDVREILVETPYADVIAIQLGAVGGVQVAFMARHGAGHRLPPHKINYRANIWALESIGIKKVVAINAVGGIHADMPPGSLILPHQIIDYTYGREHTFADLLSERINHIDFTQPFSEDLRGLIVDGLISTGTQFTGRAVYGCTQGPRLESAAEIDRLDRDGCHVVGMTGMPEAALAKELGLEYAMICSVVNWAAGRSQEQITMEQIHQILAVSTPLLRQVLVTLVSAS